MTRDSFSVRRQCASVAACFILLPVVGLVGCELVAGIQDISYGTDGASPILTPSSNPASSGTPGADDAQLQTTGAPQSGTSESGSAQSSGQTDSDATTQVADAATEGSSPSGSEAGASGGGQDASAGSSGSVGASGRSSGAASGGSSGASSGGGPTGGSSGSSGSTSGVAGGSGAAQSGRSGAPSGNSGSPGGSGTTSGSSGSARPKCTSNVLTPKTATASSIESPNTPGALPPAFAIDNSLSTRWGSAFMVDPQWIDLDFGAPVFVSEVDILWQACPTTYDIKVSNDASTWTTVRAVSGALPSWQTPPPGWTLDDVEKGLVASGRYLRLALTSRCLAAYGYSLWEVRVLGDANASCLP